jgi:hypothetical protein
MRALPAGSLGHTSGSSQLAADNFAREMGAEEVEEQNQQSRTKS